MERWHSATGQRFSMRSYQGAPGAEEAELVRMAAEQLTIAGARLAVGYSEKIFKPIFLNYGRVRGTSCFAALIDGGAGDCKAGYLGESFVLECTALGLGTCWLGGSYKKELVREFIPLEEGERIRCVIAVGQPGESYAGRPRKSLSKLTGLSQEQLQALPDWQQSALSCARLAPSAVNGQPWRFGAEGDSLLVERVGTNFGYAELDCGIAMLHLELGAAHADVFGNWEIEGARAWFRPCAKEDL